MAKPLHISDIAWSHEGRKITTIALKGAVVVGLGTDRRHYVGRRDGDTITTTAGPTTAFDALQLALNTAGAGDAPAYGGLTATAVIIDEFPDAQPSGE